MTLPPITVMRRALTRRDAQFDGVFFVAVKTTGIFCRPVCKSRPPKLENVEFFATVREALHAGYRACKRCRPLDAGARAPLVVERLLAAVESDPSRRLREQDLRALGIPPSTARRQFKAYCGMTFHAYQRARRMGVAMAKVRNGANIMQTQLDLGYESPSGFRDAFSKLFGAPPRDAKRRATTLNTPLVSAWLETPLGSMLAIASDDGICLLDFVDRKGLENAILRLRKRFGAVILPGNNRHLEQLKRELGEYFRGQRNAFDVATAPQKGTDFQRRAWAFLQSIPCGETVSYAQEARAIGSADAVRAVGSANGMNYISIVIPCHRVIGADGSLTGYGGGLARKRWLIEHEQSMLRDRGR